MVFKNYYKILGLAKNVKSSQDEIKTAYREQAKKYHPDVNVNNKSAEERFKDINEAYRILSDSVQKKKYDKSWNNYIGKKLQKERMSGKEVRANDIVNMFFGTQVQKKSKDDSDSPLKGENIETKIDISLKEAYEGTKKRISFSANAKEKNNTITINIPKGIKQAQVIRIEGKGKKGKNGGNNGDLLLKINITDTSVYKLKGDDIYVNLYITPSDAVLGLKTSVNSIDGEVSLIIPKGTQNGDKISIPNKGYFKNENERGNLVIETKVAIPKKITSEEKELYAKLREISSFNPNNDVVNIK